MRLWQTENILVVMAINIYMQKEQRTKKKLRERKKNKSDKAWPNNCVYQRKKVLVVRWKACIDIDRHIHIGDLFLIVFIYVYVERRIALLLLCIVSSPVA